jgi:hypothetical protein
VAVVLIAYGDESSDGEGKSVFTVAGLIGTQEEWDAIEPEWLKRTNGKKFHATDCLAGYGDYENLPKEARTQEYVDLTKLLCKSTLWGYSASIDIPAYKNCIIHTTKHGPYLHCFADVMMHLAWTTRLYMPAHQKVNYTFDRRQKAQFTAVELADYFSRLPEYEHSYFVGSVKFSTSDEVGIQAADLFAHQAMTRMHDSIYSKRRHSILCYEPLRLLIKARHFEFECYDKQHFETTYIKELRAIEQKTGLCRQKYEDWLLKGRHSDNDRNRVRYLTYINSVRNRA